MPRHGVCVWVAQEAEKRLSNCFGSIMLKLALLRGLIVVASLVLAASHPAAAVDAASIQLKWKHQFQFAGYYQALEQGFYRDAGCDVYNLLVCL